MLTRRSILAGSAMAACAWAAKIKDQLPDERRVAYLTVEVADGSTEDYTFVSYQPDGLTRPLPVHIPGKMKYAFAYAGPNRSDGPSPMRSLPVKILSFSVRSDGVSVHPGDVLTCEFEQAPDGRTWAMIKVQIKEQ